MVHKNCRDLTKFKRTNIERTTTIRVIDSDEHNIVYFYTVDVECGKLTFSLNCGYFITAYYKIISSIFQVNAIKLLLLYYCINVQCNVITRNISHDSVSVNP